MENVPYRSAVGALMYIATRTRPDISFAVNILARKVSNPAKIHWSAAKRVFRYLRRTSQCGIRIGSVTPGSGIVA